MDKKYAIFISIMTIFLISSSYAFLTNDVNSTKDTDNISKDINNIPKDINNISKNTNNSVNEFVNVNNAGVDKTVNLESKMNILNPISEIINNNPPADRLYTVDGRTFFEGYDENNNKIVGERFGITSHEYFVDEEGNHVIVVSDNSEDNINSEDYNLESLDFIPDIPNNPEYIEHIVIG